MLCMVLVICNSVSILADTPAAETTTAEKQVKETQSTKDESASEEDKTTESKEDTSKQSDKETAPETKTTEKKEETTEATTEKKEESTTEATTKAKEETTTADKTDNKEETTTAEEGKETSEASDKKTKEEEKSTETKDEENAVTELTYENDDVIITVSANTENAIPEGTTLQVVPVVNSGDTAGQYQEVEQQLGEKATEEEYDITGFLAYDISLIDEDGNEIEPDGEVQVSMDYKNSVSPAAEEKAITDSDVTVMHLEEDENGQVKEVVDMAENSQLKQLDTTDKNEIQKTEFVTKSFSVFTITWKSWGEISIKLKYVDTSGTEISGKTGSKEINWEDTRAWVDLTTDEYRVNISGYEYSKTYITSSDNIPANAQTNITHVRAYTNLRGEWVRQYKNGENGRERSWNSDMTIYFIYDESTTVDPDPGDPGDPDMEPLGTPEHHKYIDYHEDTDDYTLTLDVEGKVGEAAPVDILLIVDKSGSMEEWSGNQRRYEVVNDALDTLTTQLIQKKPEDVEMNIGVVTFSSAGAGTNIRPNDDDYDNSDNQKDAWIEQNWTSLEQFDWRLEDCTGGTNWQAGIKEGENLLSSSPNKSQSRKYVIFLTDGEPTFRYKSGSGTITQGHGGTGNAGWTYVSDADPNGYNYGYAVNEWGDSPTLKSANGRYVIDATARGSQKCSQFATAIGGSRLMGNSSSELNLAVNKIVDEITKPVYKNVSITDTLSQYVELTDNPNFAVTAVNTENNNNMPIPLNENDYTITVYDKDDEAIYSGPNPSTAKGVNWSLGRKVVLTLHLPNDQDSTQSGVLGDNIKYSINFNVKATDFAKQEYVSTGYTHTGDLGTDAEGNDTSSGKEGFYSNDNENTFLTYQENNNAPAYPPYDKPVVQVKATKVQVSKSWVEEEEQAHNSVYVGLYKNGVAVEESDIREGFTPYIELSGTNDWTGTFEWLPNLSDGEYTVKELQPVTDDSQEPEFSINGTGYIGIDSNGIYTEGGKNYKVTYSKNNENVGTLANPVVDITITNTLEDSVQIVVKKDWNIPESVQDTITHASIQVGLYKATTQDDKTTYELVKNDNGTDAVITLEGSDWEASFDNVSIPESDISNYQIFEVVENNGSYERVGNGEYLIIQDTINNEPVDNIYQSNGGSGLVKVDGVYEGTVENTLQLGSIEITKTDTEGNLLPGAKFEVKNANNEIVATLTTGDEQSGKKGIATLPDLLPGEYTITEIQSPEGYSLLANPVTVVVGTTEGNSNTGDSYYEVVNDENKHYYNLKLKVINNKLFTMPEAGGHNIFMITLAGTAMIALAVGSTIYYRRRRGAHNKTGR